MFEYNKKTVMFSRNNYGTIRLSITIFNFLDKNLNIKGKETPIRTIKGK